jgi:hypothetical protein
MPRIPPALLVVINGFLVRVRSALISIWFGRTGGDQARLAHGPAQRR